MTEQVEFNHLIELAMQANGRTHMRPVIEKELLHYDILFALDQADLLDQLTFQGGTSLRLCYGSSRLSEDLDFAGGQHFATVQLLRMKECLEDYLGERYGLEVSVKEPNQMRQDPCYSEIKIDKWQIAVTTAPARKDIPKQKIKLEVGNISAYSRVPRPLLYNYEFLPDGYSDTLVLTESLEEVMADKLVSFVSCERHIRYRDIWDLQWLKQQGATVNPAMVQAKINDYHVDQYLVKLKTQLENLVSIVASKEFYNELSRFIPLDVQQRTIQKEKYLMFLTDEVKSMLLTVQ